MHPFLFEFGFLGVFCNGLKISFTFKTLLWSFFSYSLTAYLLLHGFSLQSHSIYVEFFSAKNTIHSHAQASIYCDRIYERKHKELEKPLLFVSDFWVFAADRTTALLSKCYCGVLFLQSHSTFIVEEFYSAIS